MALMKRSIALQAAIAIALSMGCTVYTTVGSEDKRKFLKQRFPLLTEASFSNRCLIHRRSS